MCSTSPTTISKIHARCTVGCIHKNVEYELYIQSCVCEKKKITTLYNCWDVNMLKVGIRIDRAGGKSKTSKWDEKKRNMRELENH